MADDYENLYDIENMDDGDLRDLVYQEFREVPEIDPDLVDVVVEGGAVRVSGRVGTELELQQVEHVLTDVLGIREVHNDLVVDELVRASSPEAADEAAVQDAGSDPLLGGGARRTEDSAKHLVSDPTAEMYGTRDPQEAIQNGTTYEPPDRPIQEGTWSRENH
jgi:hypothetical protein